MNELEIQKIIDEIREIQQEPYMNSISALGKKIRVERLHAELDRLGYTGERPPLQWNQLHNKDNKKESDREGNS
jgi:hypothetical protein